MLPSTDPGTLPSPDPSAMTAAREAIGLACMEVWGGHDAFEGAVSVPGLDIFVGCTPHTGEARGGDVYYVSNCAAGLISRAVLADVSGHGAEAAGFASAVRDLMRRHINTADQRRFARALNRELGRITSAGRFATALLLTYFAPTHHVIVCNAGHPRPLFYSSARGEWMFADADTPGAVSGPVGLHVGVADLPLGVIEPTTYSQFALQLQPGDLFVAYTDALVEAPAPSRRLLGEGGLIEIVRTLDPRRPELLRAELLARIRAGSGEAELDDDATLIVLHHNGSAPPRQGLVEKASMLARRLRFW